MPSPALPDLRVALSSFDVDGVWEAVAPLLPPHPLTRRNHRSALKRYLTFARAQGADVLRPDRVFLEAYALSFAPLDAGHAAALHSRLRALYAAFRTLGLLPATYDPLLGLKPPRPQARPGEGRAHYAPAEVDVLLAHVDGEEERALVLLGVRAGLTTGEVVRFTWADAQLTQATVRAGARLVPKDARLDDALRAWAARNGGLLADGTVFSFRDTFAVNARLRRLCLRANVPYRPWTALRSAFALHLWQSTHDPAVMVRHLGLSSLKAVEAYRHMEDALRESGRK
ncbi:tyrosine-type recombinase/integrase [Deinococcus aquiradiocola]|uniref:Tyr recombinase domain-containing protein n=1 Tax=Deinococcus aquiradiocola TaxID=393059 RepID=A0A917P975_9DEIO|nr:site-specific integrase [Deinococcus aquiradiocola]GGJ67417.1 hypothetical protein GCM10008939_09610 [Deinococcus aquiradiocola]